VVSASDKGSATGGAGCEINSGVFDCVTSATGCASETCGTVLPEFSGAAPSGAVPGIASTCGVTGFFGLADSCTKALSCNFGAAAGLTDCSPIGEDSVSGCGLPRNGMRVISPSRLVKSRLRTSKVRPISGLLAPLYLAPSPLFT
jgi:hypothetical protein